MRITFNYPNILKSVLVVGTPYVNYTTRGNFSSYAVDIELPPLFLHKTIKSSDEYVLVTKVNNTFEQWAKKYETFLSNVEKANTQEEVELRNANLKEQRTQLESILIHTVDIDDTIDWDSLVYRGPFKKELSDFLGKATPLSFLQYDKDGRPMNYLKLELPKPVDVDAISRNYSWFSRTFLKGKIQRAIDDACIKHKTLTINAKRENISRKATYEDKVKAFDTALSTYQAAKNQFIKEQMEAIKTIECLQTAYMDKEKGAVEEYCDMVLENSEYPEIIPKNWLTEYQAEPRILVVDLSLPSPDNMPQVETFRFVKARNEVSEKLVTQAAKKKLYDSVCHQVVIRTIHELFEADEADAIDTVVINGKVTKLNEATGTEETKTIMTVSAEKDEFMTFDLTKIDPAATFKHLKGIAATTLVNITPVSPIIKIETTDKRFIDSLEDFVELDETTNLAAMDWQTFEHLIRELFEKEFSSNGGEVKITQASSDGGVDAIAFDPDPIRGGKIVIQAKRYTNVVGVSAVRDLYGTMMNEGATKGVLVTTSNFGSDSYKFADGKPLSLLNGSNLLALLEKHGQKASINIAEAKKIMSLT